MKLGSHEAFDAADLEKLLRALTKTLGEHYGATPLEDERGFGVELTDRQMTTAARAVGVLATQTLAGLPAERVKMWCAVLMTALGIGPDAVRGRLN